MKFATSDNRNWCTLQVERYEFPDEEIGATEDNPTDDFDRGRFLIVAHDFKNSGGQWCVRGPTRTTTELERFADWLQSIKDGDPNATGCYFTEGDIGFSFDKASQRLVVHIFRDFLPQCNAGASTVTIQFPIGDVRFEDAIGSIRQQLADFPGRPALHQRARTV